MNAAEESTLRESILVDFAFSDSQSEGSRKFSVGSGEKLFPLFSFLDVAPIDSMHMRSETYKIPTPASLSYGICGLPSTEERNPLQSLQVV